MLCLAWMNAFVPSSSRYGTNSEIAIRQPPARMITGASNRHPPTLPLADRVTDAVAEVQDTVAESVFVEKLELGTHVGR